MVDDPPDETNAGPDSSDESRQLSFSSPEALLELDEVFTALGHPRRRYLLYSLVNGAPTATLPELATQIAAWENDKSPGAVSDDERAEIHTSLYHSHIPKLADLGVVEYEEDEDIVVRAVYTDQVKAVLGHAGGEEDSRQETHARQQHDAERK